MELHYTVKIQLQNLDPINTKLEYRSLYNELLKQGFKDYYTNSNDRQLTLSDGLYSIKKRQFSAHHILNKAVGAIQRALEEYYPQAWKNKYTLIISGPCLIYSRNLTPRKAKDKE